MSVAQRETSGFAIAALVLGIAAMSMPLLAPIALYFGYRARREIAAAGGSQTGDGLALAGIVLGWVSVALLVFFLVIILLVLAVAFA